VDLSVGSLDDPATSVGFIAGLEALAARGYSTANRIVMRDMRLDPSLIALSVVLLGCGESAGDAPASSMQSADVASFDHSHLNPVELRSEVFSRSDAFGYPLEIRAHNDTLLIVLDATQPFVHFVGSINGRVLSSFGVRGGGPGEFDGAQDIVIDPLDSNAFWIYDQLRRRMHRFNLSTYTSGADSVITFGARVGRVARPSWVSPDTLAALAASDTSGLTIWSPGSEEIAARGDGVAFDGFDVGALDVSVRYRLVRENVGCFDPKGRRIVRLHRSASRVEILDVSTGVTTVAAVPFKSDPYMMPDVDLGGDLSFQPGEREAREGYRDCAITDQHIFALYSGRLNGAYPREGAAHAEHIHIFSWDGRLAGVLKLDVPVAYIAVGLDRKTLYGTRWIPEPEIRRFDLHAAMRQIELRGRRVAH
jgi:hypothetical protein